MALLMDERELRERLEQLAWMGGYDTAHGEPVFNVDAVLAGVVAALQNADHDGSGRCEGADTPLDASGFDPRCYRCRTIGNFLMGLTRGFAHG
jgi:hypothetical protein